MRRLRARYLGIPPSHRPPLSLSQVRNKLRSSFSPRCQEEEEEEVVDLLPTLLTLLHLKTSLVSHQRSANATLARRLITLTHALHRTGVTGPPSAPPVPPPPALCPPAPPPAPHTPTILCREQRPDNACIA